MDTIVQWATIASPIIAVLIAIWVIKSSTKDNAKQIESIKSLAKLQIEALATEIELESAKNKIVAQQAEEERTELNRILSINQIDFRDMALKEYDAKKADRNFKYTRAYLHELNRLNNKLLKIKQQIN